MLTKGDEYPLHQTPEPVAFADTNRNFYDRYFFNGYHKTLGENFFAVALGVYPNLNVMDASFCAIRDGVQHNVHASRALGMERLDTTVGPISVEIVEPLQSLRIRVEDAEHEIAADLTYTARTKPNEEPRFTYRHGPHTVLDYTRLTQNGCYTGWIEISGKRVTIDPENHVGTRDRSWGIRPVGQQNPQPVPPVAAPQFYWLWSPLNFESMCTYFARNETSSGDTWHASASMLEVGGNGGFDFAHSVPTVRFKPGTRHAESCELTFREDGGDEWHLKLEPKFNFYMIGLGYMNPEWGHGHYKGDLATGYDSFKLDEIDESAPGFLHVQAFCEAHLRVRDKEDTGSGVLEQLIIGPHAPSGFKDFLDGYQEQA